VHGIRLLGEFFDGKPLARQLVAAYLPGWPIPADTFKVLKGCQSPQDLSCICTWMTTQRGFTPEWLLARTDTLMGINPVAWHTTSEKVDPKKSLGAVLWRYDFQPGLVDPELHNGLVWIQKPDVPGKILYRNKNYHTGDYNLFWMDVRQNAIQRADAYLDMHAR
jgi:Protein of unknown function (DUF3089)